MVIFMRSPHKVLYMVFQMVIFMRSPHKVLYMVLPGPLFELHVQSNIILIFNTCIKITTFLTTVKMIDH